MSKFLSSFAGEGLLSRVLRAEVSVCAHVRTCMFAVLVVCFKHIYIIIYICTHFPVNFRRCQFVDEPLVHKSEV